MGNLFENVILKIIKRHIEGKNLLNANQFRFSEGHSTALQCMWLADHVTLNFNNKMPTATVFLDIESLLTLHGTMACSINYLN
jgi:hypothetical protein